MKTICLAVLNYNGTQYLENLISTLLTALEVYEGQGTIVILDNQSTDNDVEWLKQRYPTEKYKCIEIIVAPENDYLFSYNWLAEQRDEEIIIFLNNDLIVHQNFIKPLAQYFDHDDVFAVSSQSYNWEGTEVTSGPAEIYFHHGHFYTVFNRSKQYVCYTLFASGAHMAVDRAKFLCLEGFDRAYYPAYCEDMDLCYRAWLRGWKSIYEPQSQCRHHESSSFGQRAQRLNAINTFLFEKKYICNLRLRFERQLYYYFLYRWIQPNSQVAGYREEAFKKFCALEKTWLSKSGSRYRILNIKNIVGKKIHSI